MAVHKRAAAQVTTDHEQVWKWVEARSGKPAAVKATHRGKDSGVIRVILPGAPKIRGGLPSISIKTERRRVRRAFLQAGRPRNRREQKRMATAMHHDTASLNSGMRLKGGVIPNCVMASKPP